jgi:TetR/AcrR family transcriptional repressor of nem operon
VLDSARDAFWSKGYALASMTDISRQSGVGNGSIYAAYVSKAELFLVVLKRYCESRVDTVRTSMASGRTPAEAVACLFGAVIDDCTSHSPSWGCLMLNSMAELGREWPEVRDIATSATAEMQAVVRSRLDDDGVASPEERSVLAASIIAASHSLIQHSLLDDDDEALRRLSASVLGRFEPELSR